MTATRKNVYIVTRTDTHSGGSIKAHDPESAARKAIRYSWMRGAEQLEVASFAGGPVGRWLFDVAELRWSRRTAPYFPGPSTPNYPHGEDC